MVLLGCRRWILDGQCVWRRPCPRSIQARIGMKSFSLFVPRLLLLYAHFFTMVHFHTAPLPETNVEPNRKVLTDEQAYQYMMERNKERIRRATKEETSTTPYPDPIDISGWKQSGEQRAVIVQQVVEQATTVGSFQIAGHGIDPALFRRIDESYRAFLADPTKQDYQSDSHFTGYQGPGPESTAAAYGDTDAPPDLRELWSVLNPPSHPKNVAAPEPFQSVVLEYMAAMEGLRSTLFSILAEVVASVKKIHVTADALEARQSTGLFRCARYLDGSPHPDKLVPHSDFATMTIVHTEHAGLEEIRDDVWVPVPVRPGVLHVVLSELMHVWTNGLLVNNIHRVRNSGNTDRTRYLYFCGDVCEEDPRDEGIKPICAVGEDPLFGKVSLSRHFFHHTRAFFGNVETI